MQYSYFKPKKKFFAKLNNGINKKICYIFSKKRNYEKMNTKYIISDDKNLLTIIKINKFNRKYWPRKSYFMIGISIKRFFIFLEYQ